MAENSLVSHHHRQMLALALDHPADAWNVSSEQLLNMAKLLWTFDISPIEETCDNSDEDIRRGYNDGFVFAPRPFKAKLMVRSDKHRKVVEQDYESAKELLSKYE